MVRQQQYDTTPEQLNDNTLYLEWLGNNNMIPHQNPKVYVNGTYEG